MALPMHLRIGLRGEQLTARYLRERGYTMLASNFATKVGETDLIALSKDKTLCFIEVKTRSPGGLFSPSEAVDAEKRRRLEGNAAAYIKYTDIPYKRIRFDIAEVVMTDFHNAEVNLIENAFGMEAFPENR